MFCVFLFAVFLFGWYFLGFKIKKNTKASQVMWATKKNSYFPLFHYTGSLIGILIIVLYNPYITGQYKLPYIIQPQGIFRGDHVASNSQPPQVVIRPHRFGESLWLHGLGRRYCNRRNLQGSWTQKPLALGWYFTVVTRGCKIPGGERLFNSYLKIDGRLIPKCRWVSEGSENKAMCRDWLCHLLFNYCNM